MDAKINSVLSLCHDQVILSAVQNIIQNMIACEDSGQQQVHHLQTFGFGGLWRFAGPFVKNSVHSAMLDNAELFVNCLEAMVETCLPCADDVEVEVASSALPSKYASTLSVSTANARSSSLSSLALTSPPDNQNLAAQHQQQHSFDNVQHQLGAGLAPVSRQCTPPSAPSHVTKTSKL